MKKILLMALVVYCGSTPLMAAPNPFPVDAPPGPVLIPTMPIIGFTQSSGEITEGQGPARVTISLDQATSNQVSAFYRFSGTALAGVDYTMLNGFITFAPGQTINTLVIPITNDAKPEGDETVFIILSEPQNAMIGQSMFTLTIHDNDQPKGQ